MKESPEELINKAALYQISNKPRHVIKYLLRVLDKTKKYPQVYAKIYHQNMIPARWDEAIKYKRLANKYYYCDSPFTNVTRVDNPKKNLIIAKHARISPRI